jgi:hypothetical protein
MTVTTSHVVKGGVRLEPYIVLSHLRKFVRGDQPLEGTPVELHYPDGRKLRTSIVTYSVPVVRDRGELLLAGDPTNPPMEFTLPGNTAPVLPGTEVYVLPR